MPVSEHIISPGQALLILIEANVADGNVDDVERLKWLYLSGNTNDSIRTILDNPDVVDDLSSAGYKIDFNHTTIQNDPTRRYFETHLAYETLKHGLEQIEKTDLESHLEELIRLVAPEKMGLLNRVFANQLSPDANNMAKQYASYLSEIHSTKMFQHLEKDDLNKIELLVKCSFLGVLLGPQPLPLNIYGRGVYSSRYRGKIERDDNFSMEEHANITPQPDIARHKHAGLMKSTMPLPRDDLALRDTVFTFLKPADSATYNEKATWPAYSFNLLVHPFSNSISGTMLCQLRTHAQLRNDGVNNFTDSAEKMEKYFQLLTSAMLFYSGGHSLHEYTAPFLIADVQTEFMTIPDFDKITLESMFLTHNAEAFDAALLETIRYNTMILLKQELHIELHSEYEKDKLPFHSRTEKVLEHNSQLKQQLQELTKASRDNHAAAELDSEKEGGYVELDEDVEGEGEASRDSGSLKQ